jgi:hypothetical protein
LSRYNQASFKKRARVVFFRLERDKAAISEKEFKQRTKREK